ncbi:MAG TPA: hypothetical protein PLQ13_08070 [Candidatus Krumholzibacteria bacterium]|nr:hypothetical protein [Candidatus Krumholzibacteria bacterium]
MLIPQVFRVERDCRGRIGDLPVMAAGSRGCSPDVAKPARGL